MNIHQAALYFEDRKEKKKVASLIVQLAFKHVGLSLYMTSNLNSNLKVCISMARWK